MAEILKESIIKIFFSTMLQVTVEWGGNVPDTKMRLTFVKSRYLIGRYIPTIQDVGSEKYASECQSNIREEF